MTLADLLLALAPSGALPASRTKDIKTSLKYLAGALGYDTLEGCLVGDACRDPAAWQAALDTHFRALETQGRTISASTRRNTKHNLRTVFRLAEAHGLLAAPLPTPLLALPQRQDFERQYDAAAPYQTSYRPKTGPRRCGLPFREWPPDIAGGWRTYRAKCGFRLRETTFESYTHRLIAYLGYLTHVCGRTPTWEDVFDVGQLAEFVRWHGARVERPLSAHGRDVVIAIASIAKVLGHPASRDLADLRNTLKKPPPLHNKRGHWLSLAQLEAVADACLTDGRLPVHSNPRSRHPGLHRALCFQRGVMLKLLVRIPLRQRNLRDLRLGEHLEKDAKGDWQLSLRGDDLKVGIRDGQINTYQVNVSEYCPDFIPVLEEFLQDYRPKLPNAQTAPSCFLTQSGRPYARTALGKELGLAVAMRTGRRFYPHLIRTIWATEYLTSTPAPDFTTAATMLGDTLPVVMKTYYNIVQKDQHAKAKAFLGTALQTG